MINPCRSCDLQAADKNGPRCLKCSKRWEYVEALGGMTHSQPIETTDMAIIIDKAKAKEHDEFIMANPDMPPAEIAKQLGRSLAAIYMRRSKLGLARQVRVERLRSRAEEMIRSDSAAASIRRILPDDDDQAPVEAKPEKPEPAKPAELTSTADFMLVSTKGFEEIMELLKQSALRNFRTPELQALFFIHQGLERESATGQG